MLLKKEARWIEVSYPWRHLLEKSYDKANQRNKMWVKPVFEEQEG